MESPCPVRFSERSDLPTYQSLSPDHSAKKCKARLRAVRYVLTGATLASAIWIIIVAFSSPNDINSEPPSDEAIIPSRWRRPADTPFRDRKWMHSQSDERIEDLLKKFIKKTDALLRRTSERSRMLDDLEELQLNEQQAALNPYGFPPVDRLYPPPSRGSSFSSSPMNFPRLDQVPYAQHSSSSDLDESVLPSTQVFDDFEMPTTGDTEDDEEFSAASGWPVRYDPERAEPSLTLDGALRGNSMSPFQLTPDGLFIAQNFLDSRETFEKSQAGNPRSQLERPKLQSSTTPPNRLALQRATVGPKVSVANNTADQSLFGQLTNKSKRSVVAINVQSKAGVDDSRLDANSVLTEPADHQTENDEKLDQGYSAEDGNQAFYSGTPDDRVDYISHPEGSNVPRSRRNRVRRAIYPSTKRTKDDTLRSIKELQDQMDVDDLEAETAAKTAAHSKQVEKDQQFLQQIFDNTEDMSEESGEENEAGNGDVQFDADDEDDGDNGTNREDSKANEDKAKNSEQLDDDDDYDAADEAKMAGNAADKSQAKRARKKAYRAKTFDDDDDYTSQMDGGTQALDGDDDYTANADITKRELDEDDDYTTAEKDEKTLLDDDDDYNAEADTKKKQLDEDDDYTTDEDQTGKDQKVLDEDDDYTTNNEEKTAKLDEDDNYSENRANNAVTALDGDDDYVTTVEDKKTAKLDEDDDYTANRETAQAALDGDDDYTANRETAQTALDGDDDYTINQDEKKMQMDDDDDYSAEDTAAAQRNAEDDVQLQDGAEAVQQQNAMETTEEEEIDGQAKEESDTAQFQDDDGDDGGGENLSEDTDAKGVEETDSQQFQDDTADQYDGRPPAQQTAPFQPLKPSSAAKPNPGSFIIRTQPVITQPRPVQPVKQTPNRNPQQAAPAAFPAFANANSILRTLQKTAPLTVSQSVVKTNVTLHRPAIPLAIPVPVVPRSPTVTTPKPGPKDDWSTDNEENSEMADDDDDDDQDGNVTETLLDEQQMDNADAVSKEADDDTVAKRNDVASELSKLFDQPSRSTARQRTLRNHRTLPQEDVNFLKEIVLGPFLPPGVAIENRAVQNQKAKSRKGHHSSHNNRVIRQPTNVHAQQQTGGEVLDHAPLHIGRSPAGTRSHADQHDLGPAETSVRNVLTLNINVSPDAMLRLHQGGTDDDDDNVAKGKGKSGRSAVQMSTNKDTGEMAAKKNVVADLKNGADAKAAAGKAATDELTAKKLAEADARDDDDDDDGEDDEEEEDVKSAPVTLLDLEELVNNKNRRKHHNRRRLRRKFVQFDLDDSDEADPAHRRKIRTANEKDVAIKLGSINGDGINRAKNRRI